MYTHFTVVTNNGSWVLSFSVPRNISVARRQAHALIPGQDQWVVPIRR